jgi:hypothetical protein
MCKKKTNCEFLKELLEKRGNEYVPITEYIDAKTHIEVLHRNCNTVLKMTPDNLLRGKSCKVCSVKYVASLKLKSSDKFIESIDCEYKLIGEYINRKTKIKIKHLKCGNEYMVSPEKFIYGRRCPKCSKSHGEKFINEWLRVNNYNFESEVRFNDCRSKQPLPFDFKVNFDNKFILIEYDGEQHFKDNYFEDLNYRKIKDNIKTEYCIKNNIILIRIPYTLYDRPSASNNRLRNHLENIFSEYK